MDKKARIKAYFEKEGPFKNGIGDLREIALQTDLEETPIQQRVSEDVSLGGSK